MTPNFLSTLFASKNPSLLRQHIDKKTHHGMFVVCGVWSQLVVRMPM